MLRLLYLALLVYIIYRVGKKLAAAPRASSSGTSEKERNRTQTPYEILGIPPNATTEEIRNAYQQRMRENHPDRVAGMSKEIRDLAEMRTKEINLAYEKLRNS